MNTIEIIMLVILTIYIIWPIKRFYHLKKRSFVVSFFFNAGIVFLCFCTLLFILVIRYRIVNDVDYATKDYVIFFSVTTVIAILTTIFFMYSCNYQIQVRNNYMLYSNIFGKSIKVYYENINPELSYLIPVGDNYHLVIVTKSNKKIVIKILDGWFIKTNYEILKNKLDELCIFLLKNNDKKRELRKK